MFSTFILHIDIYGLLIIYSVLLRVNFLFTQKQIENIYLILQSVVCRKEKKSQNVFHTRARKQIENTYLIRHIVLSVE